MHALLVSNNSKKGMQLMKFTAGRFRHRALALAVGTVLGISSQAATAAESLNHSSLAASQEQVEVFIRLSTPSVSELNAASFAVNRSYASRDAQIAQAARVDAEQAAFRGVLDSLGATELSTQRVGANGFRVLVQAGQVASLAAMPGVRSVGRVETHELANVTSVPWIGGAAVNAAGYTGAGVKIGIIDTGIDYTHANFGGPGTVDAYNTNNRNIVEPGTFPTAKVAGGFDFAGPTYSATPGAADPTPDPDPDPLDRNGHGSHVAGSAAGFGVPGAIGKGVAPDALLYALKVFSDGSGSTNLTSLAIEWAMDPNADGDMSDHLDVINMSLGSNFGEPADPSAISAENASNVGIIVVSASGNAGDVPYITSSPAIADQSISVAANVPGGRDFATLNIDAPAVIIGPKFNEEGTSPTRVSSVAPLTDSVVEGVPIDGCAPFSNAAAINGNIVLVQRGGTPAACAFAVKAQNALNAGARAMLAFNNVAGDPIVMGGITAAIPGVMVSLSDGLAIAAQATTDASSPVIATFGFGPDPTKQDRIAVFSSSGPGSGGTQFKPDLAAPGVGIVSTGVATGNGPAPNQGTSMATPHVAGAAALLRQQHPHEPQGVIKALLQNSTVNVNPSNSADTTLARNGVGALRVDRAAALSSYVIPGGVSFGRINPTATTNLSQTVWLNNMATNARNFTVTHVPNLTYPGVTVTCPSATSIGKYGVKSLKIRLRFDPNAAPAAGIFDNASVSQREVDGWCVFSDGTDSLRVGYLAAVDSASGMIAPPGAGSQGLNIINKGPAIGFADGFTWVASGGTGADDTYSSIAHLGVRRADPTFYGGDQVVEFGIAFDRTWDHISNLEVDLFLDVDKNGTDDIRLAARDWTAFSSTGVIGTFVTAQFPVGSTTFPGTTQGAFLDWIVGAWDFSDRVVILPFTAKASAPGQVPDSFNYRLVTSDRQGNTDVQTGSIDLANEIVPDLNSFGLAKGDSVHINVDRTGKTLWLFPNNHDWVQDWVVYAEPGNHEDDDGND
jgi:subtilisin family serine protease